MKFSYEVTNEDMEAFQQHHRTTTPRSPLLIASVVLCGAYCCWVLVRQMAMWTGRSSLAQLSGFAPLLFILIFTLLWKSRLRRPLANTITGTVLRGGGATGLHELETTEQEIIERNRRGELRTSWQQVKRIEVTPSYAFVYTKAYAALVVPLNRLENAERSALLNILEQHRLQEHGNSHSNL